MKKIATCIIIISLLAGLAALKAPMSLSQRIGLMQTAMVVVLHLGLALLFILGLKGFTTKLKVAYGFICAGMFLLVIGMATPAFITLFHAQDSMLAKSGVSNLAYQLLAICFVIGLHIFAKLFNVRGPLMNLWLVFGMAVVFGFLGSLIPSPRTDAPPNLVHLAVGITAAQLWILLSQTTLIYQIRKRASVLYVPALAWLFVGFTLYALGGLQYFIVVLLLPTSNWFTNFSLEQLLYLFAGLALLPSALAFHRIASMAEELPNQWVAYNFFGKIVTLKASQRKTSVDVIVYTAQLSSDHQAINAILDGLRRVTARLKQGERPNPEQQLALADVLLELEDYLSAKDPVRQWNKAALHDLIMRRFRASVDEPTFWRQIAEP